MIREHPGPPRASLLGAHIRAHAGLSIHESSASPGGPDGRGGQRFGRVLSDWVAWMKGEQRRRVNDVSVVAREGETDPDALVQQTPNLTLLSEQDSSR